MKVHLAEIELAGTSGTDIHDITAQVINVAAESGVAQGLVTVFTPGSTAAVTTVEYESGVLEDLRRVLEKLAPAADHYAHNARWGDGNGYSHVRAALMGPALQLVVHGGRPVLGTWQQVVVLDFDNRPRQRRVLLQVMGEVA
ncbi:MAG: secondary thiamine-phosphate synthase enzyme YjbQ [Deltaproteobacteria bacterium]|nr:secondary thiamine-phosphate synthase enzyme YjbQ [Deltaproteobacteria bacterium]